MNISTLAIVLNSSLYFVVGSKLVKTFYEKVMSGELTSKDVSYSDKSSHEDDSKTPDYEVEAGIKPATVWAYFKNYSAAIGAIAGTWTIVNKIMNLVNTPVVIGSECDTKKIRIQGQSYWYIPNGSCTATAAQNNLMDRIYDGLFALGNKGRGVGCIKISSGDYWGYIAISPDEEAELDEAIKHCEGGGYVVKLSPHDHDELEREKGGWNSLD